MYVTTIFWAHTYRCESSRSHTHTHSVGGVIKSQIYCACETRKYAQLTANQAHKQAAEHT